LNRDLEHELGEKQSEVREIRKAVKEDKIKERKRKGI
jgi:hypothetical protein